MVKKKQKLNFSKNFYENSAWEAQKLVCGIDEVGRGCLAGPVVTAAVILPSGTSYRLLKDSKLMSEAERLQAYKWITLKCRYSIGITHNRLIDQHNIWQATRIAMKKALINLLASGPLPAAILIDAMPLELDDTGYRNIPIYSFTQG